MSTWALPTAVRDLAEQSESPTERAMASTLIEHYRPLVEMMVLTPTGALVARRSMNEDIMNHFPNAHEPNDELLSAFNRFLDDAAKASQILSVPVQSPE